MANGELRSPIVESELDEIESQLIDDGGLLELSELRPPVNLGATLGATYAHSASWVCAQGVHRGEMKAKMPESVRGRSYTASTT